MDLVINFIFLSFSAASEIIFCAHKKKTKNFLTVFLFFLKKKRFTFHKFVISSASLFNHGSKSEDHYSVSSKNVNSAAAPDTAAQRWQDVSLC